MARPKVAILSKNLIRDQALSIIDEDGLEALTMRRLAERLGVRAASLYSHFSNKDAVLDAVVDRLSKSIDPDGFEDGWQAGLSTWANSYYDVIHRHPHTSGIFAAGSRERAQLFSMSERVHAGMVEHGWPDRGATMVVIATHYLVLGAATTASDSHAPAESSVYSDRYPHLPRAQMLKSITDSIDRDSFTLGLESLIRGLEPVHAALGPDPTPARPATRLESRVAGQRRGGEPG